MADGFVASATSATIRRADADRPLERRAFVQRLAALGAGTLAVGVARCPVAASGMAGTHAAVNRGLPSLPRALGEIIRTPPTATRAADLGVVETAARIRAGELSAVEALVSCLDRIERQDPVYRAFNTIPADRALERARRLDGRDASSPLHGVPLAVKDNFMTAGLETTANSLIFEGHVPDFNATAWARLEAAGAVLLGKTQMGPLATTRASTPDGAHTTVNAWAPDDPEVSPGGSSSGSATAVAARMAPGATGTQTGGSITGPSEAQGLTGLMPTFGRVSLYGVIPLTYTRDHVGPLARDALDAALLLASMAGADPLDPRTLGLPALPDLVEAATPVERRGRPVIRWRTRIGVLSGDLDAPAPEAEEDDDPAALDPEAAARARHRRETARRHARAEAEARRRALDQLRDLGAEVVELEPPPDWKILTSRAFNNARLPERSEIFLDQLRTDVRQFGVSLGSWINGLLLSGAEVMRGQRARALLLSRLLEGPLARCDVLVQTRPFPFDMVGLPLISLPIGFERESAGVDLPVGLTLGAGPYEEDRLLAVAAAYQSVTDWHRRRPPELPESPTGAAPQPPEGRGWIDLERSARDTE